MKKESKNIKILIKDDEHKIALFPKEETKDEKKDVNKEDPAEIQKKQEETALRLAKQSEAFRNNRNGKRRR